MGGNVVAIADRRNQPSLSELTVALRIGAEKLTYKIYAGQDVLADTDKMASAFEELAREIRRAGVTV